MTKAPLWTEAMVERLLRLHAAGAQPHEIARKIRKAETCVRTKLNMLKAEGLIAEESRQARGDLSHWSIVDQAKYWLRHVGFTERQIAVMSLDEIMSQANKRLHRWQMPQLGAKAEWLVR
jgi:chaperonin GroEL (HSP60 family)